MNMLRLYLPHRTENLKPDNFKTFESYYQKGYKIVNKEKMTVKEIIAQNMAEFEPETETLDDAWQALEQAVDLQDAWAAIAPQAEQERLDAQSNNLNVEDSDDDFAEINIPEFTSTKAKEPFFFEM